MAAGPVAAATVGDLAARYVQAIQQIEGARDQGTPLADPDPLFPEREAVDAVGGCCTWTTPACARSGVPCPPPGTPGGRRWIGCAAGCRPSWPS